jgi:CDP-diacylglycerol pyrophosphatase
LPFEANDVVYELDINGRPFQNIMQLRAAKIKNFLSLAHDWNLGGFVAIRYEDIIGDKIAALVQKTENALHVESSCPKLESFNRKSYNLSNEFHSWITDQTDWKVEALVGYFPE